MRTFTRKILCSGIFSSLIILYTSLMGQSPFEIKTSSYIGDGSNEDGVYGVAILADQHIIIAAEISNTAAFGATEVQLHNGTANSKGCILRLAPDGQTVLSITRLGNQIRDLSTDANGNIYVALGKDGIVKLNPTADQLLWSELDGTYIHRIDVSPGGYVVALQTGATNLKDADQVAGKGNVFVYNPAGNALFNIGGKNNTHDVAIDEASSTVAITGWRQAAVNGVPIQISYLRGVNFAGEIKYTHYDWSTDQNSPNFVNKPENNMADTRGYRCAMGADGYLYVAYESAGGNHIFRYEPDDINTKATDKFKRTDDSFSQFYNSKSEHKTVVGKYQASNGAFLAGLEVTARLSSSGAANTLRVKGGSIEADKEGRIYLGGISAYGLPMPPNAQYKPSEGEVTFSPESLGEYVGGAYLIVFSPNANLREYTTRLNVGGLTRAIGINPQENAVNHFAWGGFTKNKNDLYTSQAIQSQEGGGDQDGFFALISNSEIAPDSVPEPPAPEPEPEPSDSSEARLKIRTLLEGLLAEDQKSMQAPINTKGLIPLAQPFNEAPYNYAGDEQLTAVGDSIVDWILIELRSANDPTSVLFTQAALLGSSGNIYGIDGEEGVFIANATDSAYYVTLHARAHLPIVSANPIAISASMQTYDFTTAVGQAKGNEQLKASGTQFVQYAGDYDGNGNINSSDFNLWKQNSAAVDQYLPVDGDGNGIINNLDFNLWRINRSKLADTVLQ